MSFLLFVVGFVKLDLCWVVLGYWIVLGLIVQFRRGFREVLLFSIRCDVGGVLFDLLVEGQLSEGRGSRDDS